jgi:hypothetical protein
VSHLLPSLASSSVRDSPNVHTMSIPSGVAAGGAGDPRLSITGDEKYQYAHHGVDGGETATPNTRSGKSLAIRDPSVQFEEYVKP